MKEELKYHRNDPLQPLIAHLSERMGEVFERSTQLQRYSLAYSNFYASLARFLPELSIAARWSQSAMIARKHSLKYTPAERRIADKYNRVAPFLDLDFYNCLIHGRILMDRAVGFGRYYLKGGRLPSFHSFADHKRFFTNLKGSYGSHEEYARYILERTGWFESVLKITRDQYVVHSGPKHVRLFGFAGATDMNLIILPHVPRERRRGNGVPAIIVSVPGIARKIHDLLEWMGEFGAKALDAD